MRLPAWSAYTRFRRHQQVGDTIVPAFQKMMHCKSTCGSVSGNTDITVTGYRFRYAPNAVP